MRATIISIPQTPVDAKPAKARMAVPTMPSHVMIGT